MNQKTVKRMIVGLAISLLLSASAQAEKKKVEMSPEMQAKMAKAKELGTPGAEHGVLKAFEGEWKVTSRSWMKPGSPPEESSGTSSMEWILGGRFLKQKYKGEWAGEKFEGLGFIGYDKMKKRYVTLWMDNMATGIFQSTGRYDAATQTIKESGHFSCPMTGEKDKWFRAEWKLIDKNKNSYTWFMKDPNGKEFKSMEIVYTR